MNPRFFTGMTFAFCGSFSLRTLEAMKVPAPHNEKQSKTIVIFVSKLMDQFQAYPRLSVSSLRQTPQVSKAINARVVSIRPTRL